MEVASPPKMRSSHSGDTKQISPTSNFSSVPGQSHYYCQAHLVLAATNEAKSRKSITSDCLLALG